MSGFIWWLIYGLDWRLQALIVLLVAGAIMWMVGVVFGWAAVRKVAAPIIGLAAVLVFWNKSKQEGYGQRVAEEQKAKDEASDFAADKRDEVKDLPADQLDDRFSRWEKH